MITSGSFSSFDTLRNSVEAALVANGWVLVTGVLNKNGVYLALSADPNNLVLQCGTGQFGAMITGAGTSVKLMNYTAVPMNFPATYDLHIFNNPEEVVLVINYNADRYQQLSFGFSDVPNVGGLGFWYSGTFIGSALANAASWPIYIGTNNDSIGSRMNSFSLGLFAETGTTSSNNAASFIHTGLDAESWKGTSTGLIVGAMDQVAGLLHALPSQFNQNTVLLPLNITQRRLSQGQTNVASLRNVRLCRIDNHLPGEVVSYGPDQWRVYPFHRKNADVRDGVDWATGAQHTGTFGYAVRYEVTP